MQFVVRLWPVAFTTLAVALSRPLAFEEKAVITVSDVAYTECGGALAIDRLCALITAAACEEFEPETPNDDLIHDNWNQRLSPGSPMRCGVSRCAPLGRLQAGGLRIVERAAVVQPFSEAESFPARVDLQKLWRRRVGTQPYASANPPEGAQFFGDAVATRGGDAAESDDFVAYQP